MALGEPAPLKITESMATFTVDNADNMVTISGSGGLNAASVEVPKVEASEFIIKAEAPQKTCTLCKKASTGHIWIKPTQEAEDFIVCTVCLVETFKWVGQKAQLENSPLIPCAGCNRSFQEHHLTYFRKASLCDPCLTEAKAQQHRNILL